MTTEQIQLVADSTAILSLRDSDFDAYSAFGEVVDNSQQAGAKKVSILFKTHLAPGRKNYQKIEKIFFIDDGVGMEKKILHRCLQLGYSSRFNDRTGIGRFGVGMTLGAINQCKRVEVYSRQHLSAPWLYTYIDIDEIISAGESSEGIPEPSKSDVPAELKDRLKDQIGTVVVWSKYDRQPNTATEMLKEFRIWLGRTFRYFLWDGIKIDIDGQEVKAIDPLYIRTKESSFPADIPSKEYEPMTLDWLVPVDRDDLPEGCPDKSKITIRMSLIDKSLRPTQGSGNHGNTIERCIDRNEGISIIRNKREVFYGHIPYWKPAFKEIDRWWGCEIQFDAILDREFTVKNIKRGAIPSFELKEKLKELINPTRNTAVEEVQQDWQKIRLETETQQRKEKGLLTGHEKAEEIAKQTPTDKNTDEKLDKKAVEDAAAVAGKSPDEVEKYKQLFKQQPFTIKDDQWSGNSFWEVTHMGGSDLLRYNQKHKFFEILSNIRERIKAGESSIELSEDLLSLVDLLLISYAKAEQKYNPEEQFTAEELLEIQRNNWGDYLRQYLKTAEQNNK